MPTPRPPQAEHFSPFFAPPPRRFPPLAGSPAPPPPAPRPRAAAHLPAISPPPRGPAPPPGGTPRPPPAGRRHRGNGEAAPPRGRCRPYSLPLGSRPRLSWLAGPRRCAGHVRLHMLDVGG